MHTVPEAQQGILGQDYQMQLLAWHSLLQSLLKYLREGIAQVLEDLFTISSFHPFLNL